MKNYITKSMFKVIMVEKGEIFEALFDKKEHAEKFVDAMREQKRDAMLNFYIWEVLIEK